MTSILHTTDRDDTFCLFHIPLASFLPSLPILYFLTKKNRSCTNNQPNKQAASQASSTFVGPGVALSNESRRGICWHFYLSRPTPADSCENPSLRTDETTTEGHQIRTVGVHTATAIAQ